MPKTNMKFTKRSKSGKSPKRVSKMSYAPVAMSTGINSQRIPKIGSNGKCTRINHSEFFTSVVSTGIAYAVTSCPLNPGVASIFPWLSQVAARFDTYKFRKLSFRLHTRAATSQVGTVGMAFDFDAQDAAPASQMEALTYHDKCADSPWKDQTLTVDLTNDHLLDRYTRVGIPPTPYDLKTLDLGNLHIFTDGVAASTNLGIIEVVYEVDLYIPQTQNPVGGKYSNAAGLDATHLVGTVASFTQDPQAIAPFTVSSTSTLLFTQEFEGLITCSIAGTVLSAYTATISADGTAEILCQQVNAGATSYVVTVRVRAHSGTTFTPTMTATTVTGIDYFISRAAYTSLGL